MKPKSAIAKKIKITKLDQVFSKWIRERDNWTCQVCHKNCEDRKGSLHCSHFYTRTAMTVRFDPDNADALCFGCHREFERRKNAEYLEWKKKQLGEKRFNKLRKKYYELKYSGYSNSEREKILKRFN